MSSLDDKAGELHDFAADRIETGFVYEDVRAEFGWDYWDFMSAVRRVRRIYADDEWTLICDPQGQNERWRYRWARGYEEAKVWLANRTGDGDSRLHTMLDVAQSAMNGEDGRSIPGRKARKRVKAFSRLIEDLAELEEEVAANRS